MQTSANQGEGGCLVSANVCNNTIKSQLSLSVSEFWDLEELSQLSPRCSQNYYTVMSLFLLKETDSGSKAGFILKNQLV